MIAVVYCGAGLCVLGRGAAGGEGACHPNAERISSETSEECLTPPGPSTRPDALKYSVPAAKIKCIPHFHNLS